MAENESSSPSSNNMQMSDRSVMPTDNALSNSASKVPVKPAPAVPQATATAPATTPSFPPPKTDKPRPHVCTTCMRSFARLEHLKRHERSHTKEKPFECPSCTRCFARRDLLLRHQQKLHSTTTPSSKPRNGRRESTTGVANGRVRKNSMASAPTASMRPRANTLSHIDASTVGMLSGGNYGRQFAPAHNHHNSFSGIAPNPGFGFRNAMNYTNSAASGLPKLETQGLSTDPSNVLRTAPPFGGFGVDFDMGGLMSPDGGNTINPHALHMHSQGAFSMDSSWDGSQQMYLGMPTSQTLTEEDGFDWVTHGFENQMNFAIPNETAIDDSSPSAMSTNSPAQFIENGQNAQQAFMDNSGQGMNGYWQHNMMNTSQMVHSPMNMDLNPFFGEMAPPLGDTISPKSLLAQKNSSFENSFATPPELSSIDPSALAMMSNGGFVMGPKYENIASTASTASMDSSLRNSSVTTASSELVTEQMRTRLIAGLNQSSAFGQRKQSQPAVSSPLSPAGSNRPKVFTTSTFPSTSDLQRYVAAYIKYYHPHLPFLHIATLNFESNDYTSSKPGNTTVATSPAGGPCLMLSIAALGALFESEMTHSRDLFECAKRLISSYLEERRKSQMSSKSQFLPHQRTDRDDTPLWLVQAMLLNVIYGHNCGDKQAADIASNHCAALVSLARGAELAKPYPTYLNVGNQQESCNPTNGQASGISPDGWNMLNVDASDNDWYEWKVMEERKRTLYAIFVLSSMLVTAYNRAPALTNSEIRLDLPCEEELWSADSAQAWRSFGGVAAAESCSVQFASALTHLLTAAQRQRRAAAKQMAGEAWQAEEGNLSPSSFGCLVLINALHNYIWETRQRHLGRQWTPQEIESMHAHIEPALRAWQSAWRSNPTHATERPNPFGAGPLSADSIPLLDLAYVRLFVDFGRSKEAYWQRDYDMMAQELAKGSELAAVQNGQGVSDQQQDADTLNPALHVQIHDNVQESAKHEAPEAVGSQPTQRERHLRKAAFYAADHLMASDRLGVSLNEHNARDLPIASVLCTCDSAQVLAEWATTVQERIGKLVGAIGRDAIDLAQLPAALLLDDEDRKLFGMLDELLANAEAKHNLNSALIIAREGGYGSRILILTSEIMARAAVWPVTKHMARCLETQSSHVSTRVTNSLK